MMPRTSSPLTVGNSFINLLDSLSMGQVHEDDPERYACPSDDRLAAADVRVAGDVISDRSSEPSVAWRGDLACRQEDSRSAAWLTVSVRRSACTDLGQRSRRGVRATGSLVTAKSPSRGDMRRGGHRPRARPNVRVGARSRTFPAARHGACVANGSALSAEEVADGPEGPQGSRSLRRPRGRKHRAGGRAAGLWSCPGERRARGDRQRRPREASGQKPMALGSDDCRAMIAACDAADVRLMIAYPLAPPRGCA